MKQSKTIKIDFMSHKELLNIKEKMKFRRIGSVIQYLLNNYRFKTNK
jgi:hypothetical protein